MMAHGDTTSILYYYTTGVDNANLIGSLHDHYFCI